MKIRLALIDTDQKYVNRILNYYGNNYTEKLELSYFSTFSSFKENLLSRNIDAVLISDECKEDLKELNEKMPVAYLTESMSIDRIRGIRAICKFQKPDLIYKEVLRLFSERDSEEITYRIGEVHKSIAEVFMPVSGGAGATSLAVAHAIKLAKKGIRTLYISFERLPSTAYFFEGQGNSGLKDVIYAVKSRKPNLALKLESFVRQDVSGVYFFANADSILDMMEFTDENIKDFIDEMQAAGNYERIVIDTDFDLGNRMKILSGLAYRFVLVAEQSELGLHKLDMLSRALLIMETSKQIDISIKLAVVCNKAEHGRQVQYSGKIPIKEFIPTCRTKGEKQVIEQLAQYKFLESSKNLID